MSAERESSTEVSDQDSSQFAEPNESFGGGTGVRAKLPTDPPTHRDLVEVLLQASAEPHQPHPVARHVSAVLAAWAHADLATATRVVSKLGLPDARCQRIEVDNPALSLCGAALLVQSKCGRVALVAFAGSDPSSPATLSAHADAQPTLLPVPQAGADARVLALPYRSLRASWSEVVAALASSVPAKSKRKTRKGEDEGGLEALFLSGHGSGGACASLAAYKLVTSAASDERRLGERLAQVYTFGAPMFGNAAFGRSWNEHDVLRDRVFCHLHGRDPVPHLPPRGTQPLRHVGKHYAVASGGNTWPHESGKEPKQLSSALDVVRALAPLLAEQATLPSGFDRRNWLGAKSFSALIGLLFKDGPAYSVYDHAPVNYVVSSQPKGVLSEFGEQF